MKAHSCPAVFHGGKHCGFSVPLLLIFAGIAAWQIGGTASVSAQAKTKVNPHDGLTYVWIPPGTFQMGCSPDGSDCNSDNKPAHNVTLTRGFWIGQTPETQAAYKKVVGFNPSHFQGDQLPVDTVSWDDAEAYCKSVEMRLPTEAEWEYAARSGSAAERYGPIDAIAWYRDNSGSTTHAVAQKQPNGYGLYDMLGNVFEWVADWSGPYGAADAVDPKGPATGMSFESSFHHCASDDCKILRGGPWSIDASTATVSGRHWNKPWHRTFADGFRCAGN